MYEILDNNILYCIHQSIDEFPEGTHWYTNKNDYLQVSSWLYPKGKTFDNHIHKLNPRYVDYTQEVLLCLKGSIRVKVFNQRKIKLQEFILREHQFAIFFKGGHGYEILEENTKAIEIKNGPFESVENDKERFS